MKPSLQPVRDASLTSVHRAVEPFQYRPEKLRLLVSALAVVIATAILVPASWWQHGARLLTGPGWWWLPILLLTVGLAGLGEAAVRWWRRSSTERQRPEAVRTPLFLHVAILLLIAVAVAAAVAAGMWALFGQPRLAILGVTPAPGASPGGVGVWSVQNTFDAMKIVLSVVAGIGGVVALTVAYRKQGHSEAAEHREDTKLFNDRFGKASDHLGSDRAAVRLAGVYAMAGLADDWEDGRQTCIDVLCAYLRMPYTPPPPDSTTHGGRSGAIEVPGLPLSRPHDSSNDDHDAYQERQVRHTVLALIRQHIQPADADGRPRWHGHLFDLRGAVLDGGDLRGIDVTTGTVLDLTDATFPHGKVDFTRATFSGGTVHLARARLSGGTVNFSGAKFSGGTVDFFGAMFSGGTVNFSQAEFRGTVNFTRATFTGGIVDFSEATFSGGQVAFSDATFSDGMVNFTRATFTGGIVDFDQATLSGGTVAFYRAGFTGGKVTFAGATLSGGTVAFYSTTFSGGKVTFAGATFSGGIVNFHSAAFYGGLVSLAYGDFKGTQIMLSEPRVWRVPPEGIDGSELGVTWPSSELLGMIDS
ncbi:pentapeptide repeat-containing protein [Actinoplanes auranticolor]|uniref:Pentapeptide repeat protein n=1 Tax=Actinoplanes auranticolor TaxID=47988 RepID=A0A919VSW2_9ACTN|nr:pentapeptide repeat-containing protein [Actinoplanes auranticolor]GIM77619.1 hypothetical protein Aau02nite_76850 [Actinoplanes auranticolor]